MSKVIEKAGEEESKAEGKKGSKASGKKGRNYGFVLYPEDDRHMEMLDYCKTHYRCVWILHDKDVEVTEEGEVKDKKPHIHLLVKFECPRYISGVIKAFEPYGISHTEPISDAASYLHYMIHDTPAAQGKHQYGVEELQGDEQTIAGVLTKDSDEMQLEGLKVLMMALESMDRPSIKHLTWFVVNEQPALWSTLKSFQFILSRITAEMRDDLDKRTATPLEV